MKTRIAILGLGGVGGFVGGLLALKYTPDVDVEVVFIPRAAKVPLIREKGLTLQIDDDIKIIHPDVVAADPQEIGPLDILICSTKSYDLESSLAPLASCILPGTLILPLYNGVDAVPRIRKMYPEADVAEGCIYIVARILEPGVVKVGGFNHTLHFGSPSIEKIKLQKLQNLLKDAGINSYLNENIHEAVWEKFFFISTVASLTSYLDLPMGKILETPEHKEMLMQLLHEFHAVAQEYKIPFPEQIFEKVLNKIESLPYDTTSSMHGDFKKGGKTEYKSLTEYVVELGDLLHVETPTYDKILKAFTQQQAS
jgi:2-dehydropantoate 2-reductase